MTDFLKNPIFSDETAAREWLEARVWPQGPVCTHCGNVDQGKIRALQGKSHRPGLFQCAECREQFTVTVKTVFERSKIPLTKWLAALFLMTASKKGVSAHQAHRMLGISYKSTWFMMHRLREAMRTGGLEPLGGAGKVVEAEETYFGKPETPRVSTRREKEGRANKNKVRNNRPIVSLVERGGQVRSFHVPVPMRLAVPRSSTKTSIRKAACTRTKAACTPALARTSPPTKPSTTGPRNTPVATGPQTRLKAMSQCSSAVCAACTRIAAKSICIAISRNSISVITTAPHSAPMT